MAEITQNAMKELLMNGQFFVSAHEPDRDPDSGSVRLLWSPLHCRAVSVCRGEENSSGVE